MASYNHWRNRFLAGFAVLSFTLAGETALASEIFRDPYGALGYQVNFSTGPNGSGGSDLGTHYYENGVEGRVIYPASARSFLTASDAGKWRRIVVHVKAPTGQGTADDANKSAPVTIRAPNIEERGSGPQPVAKSRHFSF